MHTTSTGCRPFAVCCHNQCGSVMKINITGLLLIFLIICGGVRVVTAQDFRADLEAMQTAMKQKKRFGSNIEMVVYARGGNDKVMSRHNMKIRKKGNKYFMKVMMNEVMYNGKEKIAVNHNSRSVVYKQAEPGRQKKINAFFQDTYQEDKMNFDAVTYAGTENGLKHYVISNEQGMISRADYYIDPESKLLEKLTYFYDEQRHPQPGKVQIRYDYDVSGDFASFFNAENYIIKNDQEVKLVPELKNYQLNVADHE